MEPLEIGTATIRYNEQGKPTTTGFISNMNLLFTPQLTAQLRSLDGKKDTEQLKKDADLLLGAYFNKIDEVWMANRDEYEIASEIVNCEKYDNGNTKTFSIKYIFRELKTA
jgi:hypothetical protein